MKFLTLLFAITSSSQCLAQSTDWLRIGQGNDYIVDINKKTIIRTDDNVRAVARMIPRTSRADIPQEKNGVLTFKPRSIFIKIAQGTYNCKTLKGSNYEELDFDTNMREVGGSKTGDGFDVVDELKIVLDYACSR